MNEFERLRKLAEVQKELYPPGTRMQLLHTDDPNALVDAGTRGTVVHVDEQAKIHVKWDIAGTHHIDTEKDSFRMLTEEELAEEKRKQERTVELGEEGRIVLPDHAIDCSRIGYFDDLEDACWELVELYCHCLGIEMLPNEDGERAVSYDIAKGIQDKIIEELQQAGVEFKFEEQTEEETEEMDESETNDFVPKL